MKQSVTILLATFCMVLYSKPVDYTAINRIVEKASKTTIINIYNQIITDRSFNSSTPECSFESIKCSLKDNEIAIEILVLPQTNGDSEYVALTVKKNYEVPHFTKLFTEQELEYELHKGEGMFTDTTLSALLLVPLYDELIGVEGIFFTPAGKLHLFPIEYCNVKNGIMLCEKYSFSRLTSSAMLIKRKKERELYKSYAIYGGIDFDALPDYEEKYEGTPTRALYGYLLDSYHAAVDIHHILTNMGLHGKLYSNETATENSFKTLSNQDIQLLLVETHGIAVQQQDTFPNALMFAGASYVIEGGIVPKGKEDGLLTSQEIANLNLSSIDLAVISACSSALGEIDEHGVGGFLRAFKTAGVNSLVMTTNDVADYVAGEVWRMFFRNIVSGITKRESLLNAIKHVKTLSGGGYNSPQNWTPFILIDGID